MCHVLSTKYQELVEARAERQEARCLKTRVEVQFNGSPLQHSALGVQRSTLDRSKRSEARRPGPKLWVVVFLVTLSFLTSVSSCFFPILFFNNRDEGYVNYQVETSNQPILFYYFRHETNTYSLEIN